MFGDIQMNINGYILKSELKNANSGFSKWGFAAKNGKEYFIKELINPVYPINKDAMTEKLFCERRNYCFLYVKKFKKIFEKINNVSRGNLIRVNEFFRYGSRYYLITEKVGGEFVNVKKISVSDEYKKLLLLKTAAQSFMDLHSAGIVHFDVKPSNILVKISKNGNYTAKVIDFDSGFFKGDILDVDELGGDLTYLAPETFLGISGENVIIDEKADIFALGLVFHEYWCGKLPYYNKNEYEYPYEAVLDGNALMPDLTSIPDKVGKIICDMLNIDPKQRPSAEEIIAGLNEFSTCEEITDADIKQYKNNAETDVVLSPKPIEPKKDDWFTQAGDL